MRETGLLELGTQVVVAEGERGAVDKGDRPAVTVPT